MKEVKSCPTCGSEQLEQLCKRRVEYPEAKVHPNLLNIDYVRNYILFDKILHNSESIEFSFKICKECGLIFFSPRPEEKDMATKYLFINVIGDTEKREKYWYSGLTCDDDRAMEIYKVINNVQEIRNSIIVDVGGARGFNLKYFKKNNKCFVVDYEKRPLLEGVDYLGKTVESIRNSVRAKVVLLCHTLEHMVNPRKEILSIKEILEPGGLLYIEVPLGCKEFENLSNFLTHINFFSEGSLYYLLDACGFNIRYLKLKPALGRVRYNLTIIAIAENTHPRNRKIDAYRITRAQMKGMYYWLRQYQLLLNIKIMNLKLLPAIHRYFILWLKNRRSKKMTSAKR